MRRFIYLRNKMTLREILANQGVLHCSIGKRQHQYCISITTNRREIGGTDLMVREVLTICKEM